MDVLRFPPFLLLLCLVPALLAWKFMDRSSRPPVLVYALRWFLGLTFTFSGLAKLIPGFPNTIGPVNLESALAPHGLGLFARFVAVSELAVGLLLLTRRFATLGALMLLPMLASILMVTISLQWRGTPFVNSGLLLLNLGLILYDYPKLAPLIGERSGAGSPLPTFMAHASHLLWLAGLGGLLLAIGILRIDIANTISLVSVIALLLALIVIDWRSARQQV